MLKVIQLYFDTITKIYLEYHYFFEHYYNINESKFAVKTNQLLKILMNICKK